MCKVMLKDLAPRQCRLVVVLLGFLSWSSLSVSYSLFSKRAFDLPVPNPLKLEPVRVDISQPISDHGNPDHPTTLRATLTRISDFARSVGLSDEDQERFQAYLRETHDISENPDDQYYTAELWKNLDAWRHSQGQSAEHGDPLDQAKKKMSERNEVMFRDFAQNMLPADELRKALFANWLIGRFPTEANTLQDLKFYNLKDLMTNFIIWARENNYEDLVLHQYLCDSQFSVEEAAKHLLQHAEAARLYKYGGTSRPAPARPATEEYPPPRPSAEMNQVPVIHRPHANGEYLQSLVNQIFPPSLREKFIRYMNDQAGRHNLPSPEAFPISDINHYYAEWQREQDRIDNLSCFGKFCHKFRIWWGKVKKYLPRPFCWYWRVSF